MSGTSLDGIDTALIDFKSNKPVFIGTVFLPFNEAFKSDLLALHHPGNDELNKAALTSNQLAHCYAEAITDLLKHTKILASSVTAIGCHGQTIRHCPTVGNGYSIQLVNAALLAELTGITVVSDFRNRDIAAGGQGAPLVPAFHRAVFMDSKAHRVIVNIGGIANITYISPRGVDISGFDCGPGNMLMDAWCRQHTGNQYDNNGDWAATGQVISDLLEKLLSNDFFSKPPPKSTGRDLFNDNWLRNHLRGNEKAEDVQATLMHLTIASIAHAIDTFYPSTDEIYLCGGGAHNSHLVNHLKSALPSKRIKLTDELGVQADWVEACAFAWLAQQTILKRSGNVPAVTGARGERILGAVYYA